jgi:hypothetical protein
MQTPLTATAPKSAKSAASDKQQTNMSLCQWNSVAERARLQHYVLLAEMMLEEEEDGDSSDDDSEALGGMPMEMEFIIDHI